MLCTYISTYLFNLLTYLSFFSPRFELPAADLTTKEGKKLVITCHFCGENGHKALYCNKMPPDMKEAQFKAEEFRVSTLRI